MAKDDEVATNVRTTVIMARKSRGEIGIDFMGDAKVLGPAKSTESGGTGGVDDASSGSVAGGAVDAGMWGSSIGTAGGG